MEALVLPAQDQLACHQDGRAKEILRSSGMQPRSHCNSCASASQCEATHSSFSRNSSSPEDSGCVQSDASAPEAGTLLERQSFVVKALTFRFFHPPSHPSSRSQSRGSASLRTPAAADCLVQVQDAHVSSSGFARASLRSFSVPRGHGWRRIESAPRKDLESEGGFSTSDRSSRQLKTRKTCVSEKKASGSMQPARKSEGCFGSGTSSLEKSSLNREEKHQIERALSSTSFLKDDSEMVGVIPAVTILQRPKSQDAAMSNLARVLAADGVSLNLLKNASTSVCQSGGVSKDSTPPEETLSTKSSFSGYVGFHNTPTPLGNGEMSVNNSGSKENSELPLARSFPDAVMVRPSGRTIEHVWRESVACISPDRSEGALRVLNIDGRRRLSVDLETVSTGSVVITNEASTREVSSSSSSPPLNERWAGPGYSNSPPPSSLPFPKFSMRQWRTTSLEIPPTEVEFCKDFSSTGSLSAPATPSRSLRTLPSDLSSPAAVFGLCLDVASATRDLRRILNLDADT